MGEKIVNDFDKPELPDLNISVFDELSRYTFDPMEGNSHSQNQNSSTQSSLSGVGIKNTILEVCQPSMSQKQKEFVSKTNGIGEIKYNKNDLQLLSNDLEHTTTKNEVILKRKRPSKTEMLTQTQLETYIILGEEKNKSMPPFLNVYNWEFLSYQDPDTALEHNYSVSQNPNLEFFFKTIQFQDKDNFYFIPPKKFERVVRKYNQNRYQFRGKIPKNLRLQMTGEIVLNLSDQKLNLEGYSIFSNGLMKDFISKIEKRLVKTKSFNSIRKMESISNFISNITKMSTFLIVVRLSLFKEHTEDVLRKEVVENILAFIKKFLEELEDDDGKILNKPEWAKRLQSILHLEKNNESKSKYTKHGTSRYTLSGHIAEYWAQENKKAGCEFTSHRKNDRRLLVEIINTMIIYSNPNLVSKCNLIDSERKSKKIKRAKAH
jgi:hypothetical protein